MMKVYYVGSRRLRYSVLHKRLDCKDDLKHLHLVCFVEYSFVLAYLFHHFDKKKTSKEFELES